MKGNTVSVKKGMNSTSNTTNKQRVVWALCQLAIERNKITQRKTVSKCARMQAYGIKQFVLNCVDYCSTNPLNKHSNGEILFELKVYERKRGML